MTQYLLHSALLVREYDEAIDYFTRVLGFTLIDDTPQSPTKRWVVVAPPGAREASLLLARAATDAQREFVGKQGGGRVYLFLHTDDFWTDFAAMKSRGVNFVEEPRQEDYGTVVVFEDLYANRWDLVQLHSPRLP
jgi:catechol 2,3-dioxygenase-like lactoylglutathione lyase family enzyme